MIGTFSAGVLRHPQLSALLGEEICKVSRLSVGRRVSAVAGWGRKANVRCAEAYARRHGLELWRLEDGFLRSFGTGDRFPLLSLVADNQGIHYDGTRPSGLETLLNSREDLLAGIGADVEMARERLLRLRLSKYNEAADLDESVLRVGDVQRVLLVDQTFGDLSVKLGAADAVTFTTMLDAARAENPDATIYIKTHPEVSSGRKRGYLTAVQDDARTVVLRQGISPLSLIERMDRVYVVTSTMGFEALLVGKPVTVFGMPWYAGWGATDDRQRCPRRSRTRTVDELFAAGYFHYSRYLDPTTGERGTIFDVIDWLARQRSMASRFDATGGPGRMLCVGFRRWKAANVRPMLSLHSDRVHFVRDAGTADRLTPGPDDYLVHWGRTAPPGVEALAARSGARLLRMEDGFVRSVGLGADLVPPLSLVLDDRGIYFDPLRASGLEHLLNTRRFTVEDRARARAVTQVIVAHGITKYNTEPRRSATWASQAAGRTVVLVPGQVEDDASIRFGCEDVDTNLALLEAARVAHPEGFIVYKPHPDVLARNRVGAVALTAARRFADHVETEVSVVSCIEACDAVHTMTSLTGFDALLRGKQVVVYGRPFYAGWGLTEDRLPMPRRERTLSIDELVAGALLHYPLYWDWELKGYTTCEAVLHRIVETRARLEAKGGHMQVGHLRRQWRKLKVLLRNWRG
ncbi:capsular polysaccharide biosynthesis protein [Variovorax sp. J31P179]|mgnify:CR=1 FL=1|uniref:capsular polysaccharide biosynthesis protein n=1 Tax=Variovorax sp. J31P179 TaxID=3053508 RepID=UPI00257688F1|nr:capsular polysaccharide biosynthesis protein [Variovorax sp. J31P179]MDM0083294.1 capsular polysaccharide biosynthesis protein [Variovorax sp. J31P179]